MRTELPSVATLPGLWKRIHMYEHHRVDSNGAGCTKGQDKAPDGPRSSKDEGKSMSSFYCGAYATRF